MQRSKIFLHPSSYEGFSGVCQEALYAGAHVISFCKAMNHEIEHWHIVKDKEEMTEKAGMILRSGSAGFDPVLTYDINDSVNAVMNLFGYNEVITR
jgi:glycosyltransferase involved in cell wall biosynthesis